MTMNGKITTIHTLKISTNRKLSRAEVNIESHLMLRMERLKNDQIQ